MKKVEKTYKKRDEIIEVCTKAGMDIIDIKTELEFNQFKDYLSYIEDF